MIIFEKLMPSENGVQGTTSHALVKTEIGPDADTIMLHIWSWISHEARRANREPTRRGVISVPIASLVNNADFLEEAISIASSEGWFLGAVVVEDTIQSTLEEAKSKKHAQINNWWISADNGTFEHAGKTVNCDRESRRRIETINGHIVLTNTFPSEWVGGWRTLDNSVIELSTKAQWEEFYKSMVSKGLQNFSTAQSLKLAVAEATTIEAVKAISWP